MIKEARVGKGYIREYQVVSRCVEILLVVWSLLLWSIDSSIFLWRGGGGAYYLIHAELLQAWALFFQAWAPTRGYEVQKGVAAVGSGAHTFAL
jgi:hypothetical protein